jgi:hypothetical protein
MPWKCCKTPPNQRIDDSTPSGHWCRNLSLVLAALSMCELIASNLIALSHAQMSWGLFLIGIGWIPFYFIVYTMMAKISELDPQDPSVANYPKFSFQLITARRPQLLANLGFVLFPSVMVIMASILLWAAATGQIHK